MNVVQFLGLVVAAYVLGSIPTANALAKAKRIDLRSEGSGNPGANHARRVGGKWLGVAVLIVEMAKGALIVFAAKSWWGPDAANISAIAAVSGNIFNPWYRFRGGQGLGITVGVLAVLQPLALMAGLAAATAIAITMRSAPLAALGGLVAVAGVAISGGAAADRPVVLVTGLLLVIVPKQVVNLRRHNVRSSDRLASPGSR